VPAHSSHVLSGAGDDAVADCGVEVAEKDKRVVDQNRQIHPAPLACVLLVEIAAVGARHKTACSPRAASWKSCRDWG
jgi:hypothetical protein